MDWFEKLTGFREHTYTETRRRLKVCGDRLASNVNGRSFGIGTLELVSLSELRRRLPVAGIPTRGMRVDILQADVRELHRRSSNDGALFQVASQFNLLEMIGPSVTPEQGVGIYERDPTQGPACAIAAGAATIYRNYFAPVDGVEGQTSDRQLNGLRGLGEALSVVTGLAPATLWSMKNGYALCTPEGLAAIDRFLSSISSDQEDILRGKLAIGLHWDVEVTDAPEGAGPIVSQAFCSALPVAYSMLRGAPWARFGRLVLEAAYEATIIAAILNTQRGKSDEVFLTALGGGAFGNDERWIKSAILRALRLYSGADLRVRLVSYGKPAPYLSEILEVAK